MDYMSGEGISRPAKTTIIKERNGKREKEKKREKGGRKKEVKTAIR